MTSIDILASAEIVPATALGQRRIKNRPDLIKSLEQHRRAAVRLLLLVYVLALVVAVGSLVLALIASGTHSRGLLPVLGGAAFISLLEFCRRLTKDWMLTSLPLRIAAHASDEQLARLIEDVLSGFGKSRAEPAAKPSRIA